MNNVLVTIILASVIAVSGKSISNAVHNYGYPRYAFNYAVNDPLTRDHKAQWEERDGDQVKGGYSLLEPDGKLRVVEYSANDLTGFKAIVKNFGNDQHSARLHELTHSKYGFGAVPLTVKLPRVTLRGISHPWDSATGSYGGWVPLDKSAQVSIIRKKYINGRLHKLIIGPISLVGKTIVIKKHVP